jgi:DNA polymerase-3 subunit gamma/tau
VVCQQALTQTLRNAIRTNHLAHAYLFCGPRGVGKTTCARIFAKTINCLSPTEENDACNQCESCTAFNEQRSFNIHELDAASNNSVEDIRSLIDQVRIPPQIGKYSVYIIDEVHMLSGNAFNALLKTLEEPPKHAIFILATTEKHKILATILSRCQVYDFNRITVADTISHLQYVAQKENINASEEALNVVAQKADGGMRDALSIFDQLVAFCGTNISYEQAIEVLNVLDSDYYFRLVDAALSGDVSNALLLLNEVLVKGFDAGHFITGFAQHLRDVLVSKDSATVALLETPEVIRQQYQAQAQRCAAKWLFNALDIMNTCDINYRTAKNKRLTVELALIKLCRLLEPAEPIQTNTQPTQRTAVASPQPSVKTATQPSTPIQQQATVKPTIAPPPPKPVIGAMPSLGNLGLINTNAASNQANSAQTSTGQSTTTEKRNTPFTIDQLKSAWVGQVKNFEKEERFKAMLITYEPVMDSEHMFHITVKNQLQKKVFSQFGKQLMDNIRNELQNDHIQLKVEIDEHVIGQVAYTASEKYKLLAQQNPQLDDLRQRMNLQLE